MPANNGKKDDTVPPALTSPHPLAVKRTELVWEGKYDADGRRVAPVRVTLPFQTVETVNETAQDRQMLLESALRRQDTWRNRLIWGDKKYVLPALLPEFAGRVNLIYIDPPFDTGADFSFTASVPDHPETPEDDSFAFTKEPSIIEQKAYRDTWGRGLDSYLQWFYETAVLLHELLHENGSIYVHLDWHVSFYCKAILDEVFGPDRFVNEIAWKRQTAKGDTTQGAMHMGRIHESIFLYTKTDNYSWNMQFLPYDENYLETHYKNIEPTTGRRYELDNLIGPGGGPKGNPSYEFLGVTRYWRYKRENMEALYKAGRIVQPRPGAVPRYKRYLDEMPGVALQDMWTDINAINSQAVEAVGYSTQKPESLLTRIAKLSSNEGDLVLDCFCGSGTTAAVAEKLKRRWITCDLGRFSIHTTRKRLLGIPDVRPFVVQNLGKYERQQWQAGTFGSGDAAAQAVAQVRYTEFILRLFNAKPVQGYTWLHGLRNGRMVHVGAVDGPVTAGDVANIAAEFKKAIGKGPEAPARNGVDVLGWDFAFDMNETARQQASAANIQLKFIRIPRDVMDKRAVEAGDIKFFELGSLKVDVKKQKREVTLTLAEFVIPPDDVPEEARKAVKHWSQWVDYWAVDWDFQGDTFHNEWQAYRTRQNSTLALTAKHPYPEAGDYVVVVKVIDILGNDTTKTVKVSVS